MKNQIFISIVILCLTLLHSCGKKSDPNPVVTESNFIGSWQIVDATRQTIRNGVSSPEQNVFDEIEDCAKDDYLKFSANGLFYFVIRGLLCESEEEPGEEELGTWKLKGNKLIMVSDDQTEESTYTFLNHNSMVLKTVRKSGTTETIEKATLSKVE